MKAVAVAVMALGLVLMGGGEGRSQATTPAGQQSGSTVPDQRPCGRCVGRHGERVFGDCTGSGGTWVVQECDQAQLAARQLVTDAERRRQQERSRQEEYEQYQARMKEYDWRPSSGVTLAGFNRIRDGMARDLVEHILGRPGVLRASHGRHSIYGWEASRGYGNMTVSFEGGVVIGKAQAGLQ